MRKLDFLINRACVEEETVLPPPASTEEELIALAHHEKLVGNQHCDVVENSMASCSESYKLPST